MDRTIYNWCVVCNMSYSPESEKCPRCKLTPEEQAETAERRRKDLNSILRRAWRKEGP